MIRVLWSTFSEVRKPRHGPVFFVMLLVLFLSVALQIQTDIAHIRINLADIALPLSGASIFLTLILRRSVWPQWDIPKAYFWLAGLCVLVGCALLNGWYQTGEMTSWAVYNKFVGFVVLVCYFALGGWIYSNRRGIDVIGILVAGFLLFYLAFYFVCAGMMVAKAVNISGIPRLFPFEGLMGNRNAYAVLMTCGTIFLLVFSRRVTGFISRYVLSLYLVTLPLVAGYNGSRAVWIILSLIGVYFSIRYFKWAVRHILPAVLCGVLLATFIFTQTEPLASNRKQIKRLVGTVSILKEQGPDVLEDVSKTDRKVRKLASELIRVRNAWIAIGIWRDHPVIGGGLGSILHYQYMHFDPKVTFIDVMDCTPIWLLGETGLLGLLAFIGFYGFVMRALWRKTRCLPEDKLSAFPRVTPTEAAFAEALMVFMLAFGVMSLFHEILYTRYLWVMMGMGAAVLRPSSA